MTKKRAKSTPADSRQPLALGGSGRVDESGNWQHEWGDYACRLGICSPDAPDLEFRVAHYFLTKHGVLPKDFGDLTPEQTLGILVADAAAGPAPSATGGALLPPLTDQEQAVYDFIRNRGPVPGKAIEKHFGREPKCFDRTLGVLKRARGVQNRRGTGYFIPLE